MSNVDNSEEIRLLSLCSGYAGLELGLRRVVPKLRTVAYVEVEAFACANLVSKMEAGLLDAAPIWTDIKTFNEWPFRGNVHIITAGYPCQGESCAGKRKGQADPRWLWPYIERIIEAVQPVWFFGENVSGHLTLGFPTVYRSLRSLGYTVEAGLFTAAECGAPHRRERLFILAFNQNIGYVWFRKSNYNKNGVCESENGRGQIKRCCRTLADTENPNGWRPTETPNSRRGNQKIGGQDLWPARPGQPQYEWEEPRVVANTTRTRTGNQKGKIKGRKRPQDVRQGDGEIGSICTNTTSQGQAQSRLGRAANGPSCRMDRLRLLGNGVVPQQAEKAFRYLIRKFE